MRITKAAASLLLASSSVISCTAFTSNVRTSCASRLGKDTDVCTRTPFVVSHNHGKSVTALTSVVEDDVKVDPTAEEKAWKIVKEKTMDDSEEASATISTASNETVSTASNETVAAVVEKTPELAVTTVPKVDEDTSALKQINAKADDSSKKTNTVDEQVELDVYDLVSAIEDEANLIVDEMLDEFDDTCELNEEGEAADELCVDESKFAMAKSKLKNIVRTTLGLVRTGGGADDDDLLNEKQDDIFGEGIVNIDGEEVPQGELLEKGWEQRGNSNALRRNAEVWKFALSCVLKALKPRKLRKKDATEEEIDAAKTEAATFIRNGLLKLGPSFVKLGQVVSTRTDVLPVEYTDVLKTLQDDVPGFSGKRAKDIVSKELGRPFDEIFQDFSERPLAAASLGQVHTAMYKGKKVAIKVQRAGLKELFDADLQNLKKVAALLDKFDPKTDGADRNWVSIYEESERLLYEEINYINEADNADRFAKDFVDTPWVKVPGVYRNVSTPRVLTMEYLESFKLTDIDRIEKEGLDRKLLAKRTADSFLRQIVETGYFHCDPHPGNLCVDAKGNLVFYDYGMMDELRPNVRSGFRKFCTALFAGGPMISDLELANNAKVLVDGVEEAGVLARGADRLAVEKLARFFMRSFKDKQLGKTGNNIKTTIGTDLQTLTESNVFRFPSTFTFIFRSFASIDGIGKGLDPAYDIGKLAQPFIEKFTENQEAPGQSKAQKKFNIFSKATGLNLDDIETAVTSPKKIAYIEDTMRSMESGNLKIRVRSLENEKALERMQLTQGRMENILLASLLLNVAGIAAGPIVSSVGVAGSIAFGFQAFMANTKIKKFDKTQAKFVQTKFVDDE